ncbi:MAG: hypothetical protein ACLU4B_09640, partial [Bilophila wadsworthia]
GKECAFYTPFPGPALLLAPIGGWRTCGERPFLRRERTKGTLHGPEQVSQSTAAIVRRSLRQDS